MDGLLLYRKLIVHAHSLTGNPPAARALVQECLSAHRGTQAVSDSRSLDALLSAVTRLCRERHGRASFDDLEAEHEIWALPFEARACLSLKTNFGLDFARIADILGTSEERAAEIHEEATETLRRSIRP